jgi:hypothetical protein
MRAGRLSPSCSEPEIPRLTGGHEAHRAAQAELIAHAWNLVLHSLRCTDKCPTGRSGPWPRLTLAPTALPSLLFQHDGRCGGHPGNVG